MEEDFMAEAVESPDTVASVPVENTAVFTAEETVPQKKHRKPINQQKLQDNIWGWTFCIPLIVGTVLFIYFALVLAILLSFTSWRSGSGKSLWDVLGNFSAMKSDPDVPGSGPFSWYYQIFHTNIVGTTKSGAKYNEAGLFLFNTVFYMIGIPIGMVLAVFFAVCMSRDIKGGNVFRVVYYIPCVASTIAIVYTFKLLFDTDGVMNQLFGLVGDGTKSGFIWIPIAPSSGNSWATLLNLNPETTTAPFLVDEIWCQGLISKCVIVIMSIWKGLGGTIILYIAGLSGVNAATKEAAQIDGANSWKIFWKITMPDLYPVIFYNIVTSVIGGLQIYAEPELLMGTESPLTSGFVALIYRYGVQDRYVGRGSAYGIFLAIIILCITLVQFWLDKRNAE